MLTEKEFNILYEFLDRVDLKGHNERSAMNSVLLKLRRLTEKESSNQNTQDGQEQ